MPTLEDIAAAWAVSGWWSWMQAMTAIDLAEEWTDMTEREQEELAFWTRSAVDAAVYAGLLVPPWRPTEHAYGVLHGYFGAGLSPEDAAAALFGIKH